MIQIENLSKVFRTSEVETIALNHVSMEVKEGEFVAIMGPSGCGKSTLLNILGLLDNPTEGILLLTEKFGKEFPDIIDHIRLERKLPLIVEIPDRHGTGRAPDFITSYVNEAIGINI